MLLQIKPALEITSTFLQLATIKDCVSLHVCALIYDLVCVQVSPYADSPCVECNCDTRGSQSSVCVRDDTQPGQCCIITFIVSVILLFSPVWQSRCVSVASLYVCPGVSAGQCVCKEGFAGRQCDRCAFGYRDFPQCVRCECNLSGSTNTDPCAPCTCKVSCDIVGTGSPAASVKKRFNISLYKHLSHSYFHWHLFFSPKANVMGAHCDLCKPGFYNLQDENPLGCTDCFCFGVSDVCESSSRSMAQVNTCTLAAWTLNCSWWSRQLAWLCPHWCVNG